jgi:hypothetical protein
MLRLAVMAGAVALGLIGVEYPLLRGALGRHGLVDAPIVEHDDELGWKLRPNIDLQSSAYEFTMNVRTDALGLRVSQRARDWRSAPQRVLVAGDSFAFGWGVEADEMLSTRLEGNLAANGADVAVLTAGVPGYSTDQELLLSRRLEATVRPALVILLMSSNDPPADSLSSVPMNGAIYSKPLFILNGRELELHGVPTPDKQPLPTSVFEPLKARGCVHSPRTRSHARWIRPSSRRTRPRAKRRSFLPKSCRPRALSSALSTGNSVRPAGPCSSY